MSPTRKSPSSWGGLEEHRSALKRRLKARCRDENEVDDLIQETFMRAARYRRSLSSPEKLRAWLLRIAGNVHHDHIRRELRCGGAEVGEELFGGVEGREEIPGEPSPEWSVCFERETLGRPLAQAHVDRALVQLTAPDRMLLDSHYREGVSTRVTAERLGVAPQTVKVRLFRARVRLRRAVGQALARERGAGQAPREVTA